MSDGQKNVQHIICSSMSIVVSHFKTAFTDDLGLFYVLEFLRHLTAKILHLPLIHEREYKAEYVGEGSLFANRMTLCVMLHTNNYSYDWTR